VCKCEVCVRMREVMIKKGDVRGGGGHRRPQVKTNALRCANGAVIQDSHNQSVHGAQHGGTTHARSTVTAAVCDVSSARTTSLCA
jgi:hypothetical protein